jgi:iduronate 2-sulfatase
MMKIPPPLLVLALLLPGAGATPVEPRMNVLFISADDMNSDLGCTGHPLVRSPHIDRLAARGVRFDKAYCQFPLCSPSRTSVMTGLRPDTTRVFDLSTHFRSGKPDVVTLPQLFKNAGAVSARVGKIYHYGNPGQIGTDGLDDPASWTVKHNPSGRDKDPLEAKIINHSPKRGLGAAMCWLSDEEGRDEDHTDGMVATEVVRLLEEQRDRPFFIGAGFYRPHTPYLAPKKYFDLYPPERIRLPAIDPAEVSALPAPATASTRPLPYFGVTEEEARNCKRAYYASISFVDAQIGRVLDAMDRLELWDRTVVVFWSDHGYHLGERGLWMKQSLFEESARVPTIIVAPGAAGNGKVCPRIVESLDLYPTLADLAGLPAPAGLEGVSLRPLLEDPLRAWDRPAFTQVQRGAFPGHSVRTERWRYTEWDGGTKGAELYDHRADPGERRNLAGDPGHAAVREELKAKIRRNWPLRVKGGPAPEK